MHGAKARPDQVATSMSCARRVATGGDLLAPLRDPAMSSRAAILNYGTAVGWDDDDLAIDALRLKIAEEQSLFSVVPLSAILQQMFRKIVCPACPRLHHINRKKGKLLGDEINLLAPTCFRRSQDSPFP
jgi:hypothetical protein